MIAAIAAAPSDGNGIVYVQPGTNPGIPAFTIKNGVQVLSTGPVQTLPTVQLGTVQLPISGAGTLPSVTNTVTMGNNTVLSGFAIAPPDGNPAISANAVQNVTILNNRMQVNGNDTPGILLRDVSGNATVSRNTISTSGNVAVFPVFPNGAFGIFADIANTTLSNLSLTDNTITNSGIAGHGISVTTQNTGAITNATVANNAIRTTGASGLGILVLSLDTSLIDTVTVLNNTVNTSAVNAIGVSINPRNTSSIKTAISSGNTISTAGGTAYGIIVNPRNSGSIASMTASNNRISTSGADAHGIYIIPQNTSAIADLSILNNTIATSGNNAQGIFADINQPAANPLQIRISNNILTQTGSTGIQLTSSGNSQIAATITNNTVSNATGVGIASNSSNNSRLQAIVDNNQVSNVIFSGTVQLGMSVLALNTSQLFASVTNNRVNSPGPFTINRVEFRGAANGGNLCLRWLNNSAANTGFFSFQGAGGIFRREPVVGNTGTVQPDTGVITNVAAGTCGF